MVPTRPQTRLLAVLFRHPDPDPTLDPAPTPPPDPLAELGDAGKAALAAERKARRDAERQASTTAAELAAVRAEADQLRAAAMSDSERQLAEARIQIEADIRKTVTAEVAATVAAADRRVLGSRAHVLAAGKLANPTDATVFVNLDDLDRDGEGNVSDAVLGAAIEALLKERPYLAAKAGAPNGSVDQGHRRDAPTDFNDRKQLADTLSKYGLRPRS